MQLGNAAAAADIINDEAKGIRTSRILKPGHNASEMKVSASDMTIEWFLEERARELCFEGKRWFDLMRYNYRHTATQANLKTKLSDQNYTVVANSSEFLELALRKYAVPTAMRAKIRDERYLYMPINQDEVEINTSLVQNPVYKSSSKY
jgi:hypothetical protein